MKRRDFLRTLGWAIAAVAAGEPIAKAWAAANDRRRREQLLLDQVRYEATKLRMLMIDQHYRSWHADVEMPEFSSKLDELRATSAITASYSFWYRADFVRRT